MQKEGDGLTVAFPTWKLGRMYHVAMTNLHRHDSFASCDGGNRAMGVVCYLLMDPCRPEARLRWSRRLDVRATHRVRFDEDRHRKRALNRKVD